MTNPKPYTTIGYLIADLSRLFGRVFDRRAAHLDLTRVQWRALKRIHDVEGLTQAALKLWAKDMKGNYAAAQKTVYERAKDNGLAALGKWNG